MNKYSVWYMPYNKRYLLTHPWQWFKCAWLCIRDAWRRPVYGWTYGDVWDWDSWFMHVAPEMLRYMADHGSAYPGHPPFETPEKWHEWLHNIADMIETGREDWQDEHNEYYKEYIDDIMKRPFVSEEKDENGSKAVYGVDPELGEVQCHSCADEKTYRHASCGTVVSRCCIL